VTVLDELGGTHEKDALATPDPRAGVLAPTLAALRPYWELAG